MNHRKAIRSHVLKKLSTRIDVHDGTSVITELKRQIREGEAKKLRKSDFLKKRHSKWQCFYDDKNIVVVFDELHSTIMTVYL